MRVLTASADGAVRLWSLWPAPQTVLPWGDPRTRILHVTSDGSLVTVQDSSNGVQIVETKSWKPRFVLPTTNLFLEAWVSRDGRRLLTTAMPDFPRGPVIAISGRASTGFFLHRAGRLGADNTLEKPFQPKELLAAIEAIVKTEAA